MKISGVSWFIGRQIVSNPQNDEGQGKKALVTTDVTQTVRTGPGKILGNSLQCIRDQAMTPYPCSSQPS